MKFKFFSLREGILLLAMIIPLGLLFIFKNGVTLVGLYSLIIIGALFLVAVQNFFISTYNYILVKREQKNFIKDYDTAIIIANNSFFCLKYWLTSSYRYDFSTFFKLLHLKHNKFRIFTGLNEKGFDRLVLSKKIRNIYLFGHGSRHSFGLEENKPIYYCKYSHKKITKDFIAQYHCNHGEGNALADYVVIDKKKKKLCEITSSEWSVHHINKYLKNKYKEELKKSRGN